MTIRCCVVGLGYWGKNLCRVLGASPRFDLVGGVDLLDVPGASSSLEHFVARTAVDAVVIATPASTHAAIGLEALERGYHVLVEKPLACSVSDGEKLVAAARDANRVLMVDTTYCYSPRVAMISTLLRLMGPPSYWSSTRVHNGGPGDVSSVYDLVVHDLAVIAALVPEWSPSLVDAIGTAESGQLQITGGGPVVYLDFARDAPAKIRLTTIHTPQGAISWDDTSIVPLRARMPLEIPWVDIPILWDSEPLANVVGDFADAIEGVPTRFPARSTGEFALHGLRIIQAAERSFDSGRPEPVR